MRRIATLLLTIFLSQFAFAEDLVLVNGTIIDGSGKARIQGNLRVRDGKITDIGAFKPAAGEITLDVKGLVVAPGFIDIHNHSAVSMKKNLGAEAQVAQGITTVVMGLDGTGPIAVEDFLMPFDANPPAVNVLTFVGQGTIRRSIMGDNYKRAATAEEIHRMEIYVEDAMREGAFGLSSSIGSDAGSYTSRDEAVALARVVVRYGGIYLAPLEQRSEDVLKSINEMVEVGRQAKIPVQISHIPLGETLDKAAVDAITKARTLGVDISVDAYPITQSAAATNRTAYRNDWVMVGGEAEAGASPLPSESGTFARVLGQFVRDEKLMTLEQAVRKLSALPATRLGLKERGLLRKAVPADIVVFDPAKVRDTSTALDPFARPDGIKFVFVNGAMVLKDGQPTEARPGLALR
jgi:N-acyl-D-amino-acid deacylase